MQKSVPVIGTPPDADEEQHEVLELLPQVLLNCISSVDRVDTLAQQVAIMCGILILVSCGILSRCRLLVA